MKITETLTDEELKNLIQRGIEAIMDSPDEIEESKREFYLLLEEDMERNM